MSTTSSRALELRRDAVDGRKALPAALRKALMVMVELKEASLRIEHELHRSCPLLLVLAATLASCAAAAPPSVTSVAPASLPETDPTTRQLFKAKLVGAFFRSAEAEEGSASLSLQFLLLEDFANALGAEGTSLLAAQVPGVVRLASLTPATFDATVRGLVPGQVEFGDECLVEVAWRGVDKRLVSLARFDERAMRDFLAKNASFLVDQHSRVIQGFGAQHRQRVDVVLADAAKQRAFAREVTDPSDGVSPRLGAWQALEMERKILAVSSARLDRSARVLATVREAVGSPFQASIDLVLAEVPAQRAVADELEARLAAAIAEDPHDAIVRDAK